MSAPRFKVGDKVRCTSKNNIWTVSAGIQIGETYTVRSIDDPCYCDSNADYSFQVAEEVRNDYNLCPLDFEPVTSSNPLDRAPDETEAEHLQRLVDKANESTDATIILLDNYSDKIEEYEFCRKLSPSSDIYQGTILSKFRLKQSKRTFKVAQWDASIEGDKVTIGCQEFNKTILKAALSALVSSEYSEFSVGTDLLKALRNGVSYSEYSMITWDEAEELLKELEK